jgi:TonB-dependent SusC/RagA subfamily outer membrane receptor
MKPNPIAIVACAFVVACATERTVAPASRPTPAPLQVKVASSLPDTTQAPLWILNGKIIDPPTDGSIDGMKIENIEVLKGRAAVEKYGPRAVNGVVLIKTKQ